MTMLMQNQASVKKASTLRKGIWVAAGVMFFVITFLAGLSVGVFAQGQWKTDFLSVLSVETPEDADFSAFKETWNRIHTDFVGKRVSDQDLVYGAISGMVNALNDPYSVFLNPDNAKEFQESISGEFDGIGAEIGFNDDKQLSVIAPLANSPAEQAGILTGDIILLIDEQTAEGLTLDEAVTLIRGPKGTDVNLTIQRGDETKKISITRDTIKIVSVKAEMKTAKDQKIALLQITQFTDDTENLVNQEIQNLLLQEPKGLILDLRNNPGGLLESAIDISGHFVGEKVVVIEEFSDGTKTSHRSKTSASVTDIPLVVLVNEGSASASEIVAGAIHDYKAGTILGTKTFGKGSVQDLAEFGDRSMLKLTVARWLTPNGVSITDQGIAPDVDVPLTTEDVEAERDPQFDRAVEVILEKAAAENS